ncbi:hypothetical protein [Leifsonia shinshuensis]|uniref:ABC transporter permease n=1 Tax=Leifsonia shinshuensis TaxID=150026 RepID=A0A7G6YEN6_9MICO|nr:hypothetical protein [Leifsonia shinshuensis]QNE36951.1 hypothetical protein F1C12_18750 [Leifsonia shinshuensis]
MAIVAAGTTILLAGADLIVTHQFVERWEAFVRSGASISVLTAVGRVDAARCDRLAEVPGVSAAGALRSTSRQLAPVVLQRSPIPVSEVSPGFSGVIGAITHSDGVLVGPEVVDALGLGAADALATTTGVVRVGGGYRYPDDGRRPGLSYAALAPVLAAQAFDECWIDVRPAQEMTSALLSTLLLLGDEHDPPTIAQLNPTMGATFDGPALFAERITRGAGPCAALAGLILGFSGVRSRRLEFASALHTGASHGDLCSIVTAETVAWGVVTTMLTVPVVVLLRTSFDGGGGTSLALSMSVMCAVWLAGLAGALSGAVAIRERHLFRYFKER